MAPSHRRGNMLQTLAVSWAMYVYFFGEAYGCPENCSCTIRYSALAANCAYGSFHVVPRGLPSNLSRLSLTANEISSLRKSSFQEVPWVSSLWLTYNKINTIQQGTFAILAELKSLDLSHNQMVTFPWEDLANLTILNVLKMDNNQLESLPRESFCGLKSLRSLHINNNKLKTIVKGTFEHVGLLSNLQIHSNPFNCSCTLQWLMEWANNTWVSVAEQEAVVCASPKSLQGIPLGKIPKLHCSSPTVQLTYDPNMNTNELKEGLKLMLYCNVTGSPRPLIEWKIQAIKHKADSYLVFPNQTLVISRVSKGSEGVYSCVASNEMGTSEGSVEVSVSESSDTQHWGVRALPGNTTGGIHYGEVVVISGAEHNRGETLPKASACFWMLIFILYCNH